jgi:hypothetical protein
MKNLSYTQIEETLTDLTKRMAATEVALEASEYRAACLYKALKTLCRRKDAEDCWSTMMVGPEDKPIILPLGFSEEEAGGVWKVASERQSEEEQKEVTYIHRKILSIIQLVFSRKARRLAKEKANKEKSQPSVGGLF